MHHVTLQKIEASTYSTNDQLLLDLFKYERCVYLPVCTEIITRIIVLDRIIETVMLSKTLGSEDKDKDL